MRSSAVKSIVYRTATKVQIIHWRLDHFNRLTITGAPVRPVVDDTSGASQFLLA